MQKKIQGVFRLYGSSTCTARERCRSYAFLYTAVYIYKTEYCYASDVRFTQTIPVYNRNGLRLNIVHAVRECIYFVHACIYALCFARRGSI